MKYSSQLTNTDTQDNQVRDVTPKIMTLMKTRVETLLLEISRVAPHDPSLKTLSNMAHVAGRIAESASHTLHNSGHNPGHNAGHMALPY